MKIDLFFDSIVIKLNSLSPITTYNDVVSYLRDNKYFIIQKKKFPFGDKIAKYRKMYLKRKDSKNSIISTECLTLFSFTPNVTAYSWFSVYARKEGVYIEIHGFQQYTNCFTAEKFHILHMIYNKYYNIFSFSRLDIAIDIREKFTDIQILNAKSIPLEINTPHSRYHTFKESKQPHYKASRSIKCYDKTFQTNKSFPLPFFLTRVEMTLRRVKVKDIRYLNDLQDRIQRELNHYKIVVKGEILELDSQIQQLSQDLYAVLITGKHTLSYSNKFKNIAKIVDNAKIAFKCLKEKLKGVECSSKYKVSTKTIYKYLKFFKKIKGEKWNNY